MPDKPLAPQGLCRYDRLAASATSKTFVATPLDTQLSSNMIAPNAGGGLPHQNQQPYLGINFCIALQGIYPSFP